MILQVFIPAVKQQRECLGLPPDQKAILWVDGHGSHEAPEMLQTLADEHIMLIEFVAHSSHVLQPLDRSFFGAFKSHLRRALHSIHRSERGRSAAGDIREVCLRAARTGLQQAATTETIRNGFRVAGIVKF